MHTDLSASVHPAGSQDFDIEWMFVVLGLKVVDSLEQAIQHANTHSLGHFRFDIDRRY